MTHDRSAGTDEITAAAPSGRGDNNWAKGARMIDIAPATKTLGELVQAVGDEQLTAPTPCTGTTVGQMVDHVRTLSAAFTAAARKDASFPSGPPPQPDVNNLTPGWRDAIPRALDELAAAWSDQAAWTGMTKAGGVEMPGDAAGIVALDEVVIHGWDLARATGRRYDIDATLLEALLPFLMHMAEPAMEPGRRGLFGPVVPVPQDAPLLDRVLGLTGRDPHWTAG
jgi:uncharacterized protein (TIGR03086 family)